MICMIKKITVIIKITLKSQFRQKRLPR